MSTAPPPTQSAQRNGSGPVERTIAALPGEPGPERFRLLATAVARRPLAVTLAVPGEVPYTDGAHVFVTDAEVWEQRRQVLVQAALLREGSLAPEIVKAFRGRPKVARRYLALEGRRALMATAAQIRGLVALVPAADKPVTADASESLARAERRGAIQDPPEWFGRIRPSKLLSSPAAEGAAPTASDLKLQVRETDVPEADDDDEQSEESKILKLFQNPLSNSNALTNFLSKMLGMSRQPGQGGAGGEMPAGSMRAVDKVGPHARPLPIQVRIPVDETGPAGGIGGALYPEWDDHKGSYKPEWCRVLEVPLGPAPDPVRSATDRDEVLRRRLARLGLAPKVLRRRADGDDLDVDALIDLAVDVAAGHSPKEHVYLERRKLARDLGVLVLLDASGSGTETDAEGDSVHEHQRRAAATLVATMEELGDRVALYGFRSRGRASVLMLPLKPFGARFGAGGRSRLAELEPAGYTRMGAAIRHAGEIIKHEAGTSNRLLVVLSDGFPYDDGYEGRYAEADARQALAEVREDGVAVLCLSIAASTPTDSLDRVFGSAAHAGAPRLDQLSGRMDQLFLGSLKDLGRTRARSDARSAHRGGGTRARSRSA